MILYDDVMGTGKVDEKAALVAWPHCSLYTGPYVLFLWYLAFSQRTRDMISACVVFSGSFMSQITSEMTVGRRAAAGVNDASDGRGADATAMWGLSIGGGYHGGI